MNKSILKAKSILENSEKKFNATVCRVQKRCKHTTVAECPYEPGYYSPMRPIRICLDCGLTEEGWGCGYIVLKTDDKLVGKINRNELYDLREGVFIESNMKGPLLRNEVTLSEVIDGRYVVDKEYD